MSRLNQDPLVCDAKCDPDRHLRLTQLGADNRGTAITIIGTGFAAGATVEIGQAGGSVTGASPPPASRWSHRLRSPQSLGAEPRPERGACSSPQPEGPALPTAVTTSPTAETTRSPQGHFPGTYDRICVRTMERQYELENRRRGHALSRSACT